MLAIASAILPIFLLILTGYIFKRYGFPGDGFWAPAEKLAYYVLLPVLIVRNLAAADLSVFPVGAIALVIVALALCMTAVALLMRPLLRIDGPAFTSVLQGTIRLNAYVGFAIAEALYGSPGVVLSAMFVAVMMPTVNVICIGALAAYAHQGTPDFRVVPKQIVQNPIIIGCAVGWLVNVIAPPIPPAIMAFMSIMARAALPVALLCVGAGLVIALGRARTVALCMTTVVKMLGSPAIAYGLATWAGLTGLPFAVVVMFAALPASPAAYVLARQLGGDAPLMAAVITAEVLLAVVTLPIILAWAT